MSEKIAPPAATDLFGLGGNYHPQNSSTETTTQVAYAPGADGDIVATDTYGSLINVSATYVYKSATSMWKDTSTAGAKTLPLPGQLKNGFIVTSVQISYKNTMRPTLTISGHNHPVNAHDTAGAVFNPPIEVKGGFGCPGLFVNTDTSGGSAPTSETLTLSCEHVDADGATGNHIAGASYQGKAAVEMEFVGAPTLTVPAGFVRTSLNAADANVTHDTNAYSYEKALTRNP